MSQEMSMSATPSGYGLVTDDLKFIERLSLSVMASPAVKARQKEVEQMYREDPIFQLPGAAAILEEAVQELVHQTVTYVVTEDPVRPRLLWTYAAPRLTSDGFSIQGSRFIESVDSIYRVVTVGAGYRYEITGRRPLDGPCYLTLEVWNAAQGLHPEVRYVTHLDDGDLVLEPDRSFTILVGPEPANGRKNYIHTPAGGWIIIRESLSDWTNQSAVEGLAVRLLGEVDRPAPSMAELEKRTVEMLPTAANIIHTYMHRMFEERSDANLYIAYGNSVNHLNPNVTTRGGAWGYVTGTTYQLDHDQALLVTISTDQARYFAIQLHDAWGRTLDPALTTNRNNSVSALNADGTVTYVLAHQDPGVANWLDTMGHASGSLIMRWQGITTTGDAAPPLVREAKLCRVADLKKVLSADVPMMSAEGRKLELQRRKLAYERRLR